MDHGRTVGRMLAAGALILGATPAWAGRLLLENSSANPISCSVDGYTRATGATADRVFALAPHATVAIDPQGATVATPAARITWASCGGMTARALTVSVKGVDTHLVLNGRQQRSLNVSLYPFIPSLPNSPGFSSLTSYVVSQFQAQHPDVLLNVQMTEDIDIYTFSSLPALFQPNGYDVVELDAVVLQYLAGSGLINPATIAGEPPLPVAQQASTVNGVLWGVPSWLCMDFVYLSGWDKAPRRAGTRPTARLPAPSAAQLERAARRSRISQPFMLANYDGHWRLPGMYVNAYVAQYGIGAIGNALDLSHGADPAVVANLVALLHTCDGPGGANPCIDGTYHGAPNSDDQAFGAGRSDALMDFSEQSFYVALANPDLGYYVAPAVWGTNRQPLLFTDTFVTSAATCGPGTACAADAAAFTTMMTSVPMKDYIVQSQDLPQGSPWRTLLAASSSFYTQPAIQQNRVYAQVAPVLPSAQPFPNAFSAAILTQMDGVICTALKTQLPSYACTPGAKARPPTVQSRAPH